jgi:hypothetical protein
MQEHFTNDLRVFITIGHLSLRWIRCSPGGTKVGVIPEKFVLLSPSCGFDSKELNLILVITQGGL